MGSGALLRPGSEGPGQDVLEDRGLGARVRLEATQVEASDSPEGRRGDGSNAEVVDHRGPRGAPGLRVPGAAARRRPHRSRPRQRDGRRPALQDRAADFLPGIHARARRRAKLPGPSRRGQSRHRGRDDGRHAGALPDITEDTMPGELANIIAGRVAASSTSTDRTSRRTRPVHRRWPRSARPSRGSKKETTTR